MNDLTAARVAGLVADELGRADDRGGGGGGGGDGGGGDGGGGGGGDGGGGSNSGDGGGGRKPSQANTLAALAAEAEFFHTSEQVAYADLSIEGHRETWPVLSLRFRQWLARRFYVTTGGVANAEAIKAALALVEARALFEGPEREVFVRVAWYDDCIYLDLGDPLWRAIEVHSTGWRIIDDPPVRFQRSKSTLALPEPKRRADATIKTLRDFLNVRTEADFVLSVSWCLAALAGRGPYPVLVLTGEQGSAKSTITRIIRRLVDPRVAPLRTLPREERDLQIAADSGHVLAFDNVSSLPPWLSDALCRLATGGGIAPRKLYADREEELFDATRPTILNGIEDFATRHDLSDRAIAIVAPSIPEERRQSETDLWARFERERPGILALLLDGLVRGLDQLPHTHLDALPRMADFALWATACETAYWPSGTFMAAYTANRADAAGNVIDADSVATAIMGLVADHLVWSGTATELLTVLSARAGEAVVRNRAWPRTPSSLSGRLRRASNSLRRAGVSIEWTEEGHAKKKVITLRASKAEGQGD